MCQPHHHHPQTNKKSTCFTTLTLQVVLIHLSSVVAVIVALPLETHVTNPVLLTVATLVSLLVHITFLLTASSGVTVAVNCSVCQISVNVILLLSKETPVACTGASLK